MMPSPMTPRSSALLLAALAALSAAGPAAADGFDADQARSRIEGAGYADVSQVHQGNLGDWMAQASKDGHPVMVELHPDGAVVLRQQVDTPPPAPVPGAAPAKP